MKIEQLFESFKDFAPVLKQILLDRGIPERQAELITRQNIDQFKKYKDMNRITGQQRDIGYWIAYMKQDPMFGWTEFRLMLQQIEEEIEDGVPEYHRFTFSHGYIYILENFAAAKFLCNNQYCITRTKEEFDNYSAGEDENLFLFHFNSGREYILEVSEVGMTLWNERNEELDDITDIIQLEGLTHFDYKSIGHPEEFDLNDFFYEINQAL